MSIFCIYVCIYIYIYIYIIFSVELHFYGLIILINNSVWRMITPPTCPPFSFSDTSYWKHEQFALLTWQQHRPCFCWHYLIVGNSVSYYRCAEMYLLTLFTLKDHKKKTLLPLGMITTTGLLTIYSEAKLFTFNRDQNRMFQGFLFFRTSSVSAEINMFVSLLTIV